MKQVNHRKIFFTGTILGLLTPVLFSFQNFKKLSETPLAIDRDGTTLNDSLVNALKNAEEERREKQIALNALDQEATKQKERKPSTITDDPNFIDISNPDTETTQQKDGQKN